MTLAGSPVLENHSGIDDLFSHAATGVAGCAFELSLKTLEVMNE